MARLMVIICTLVLFSGCNHVSVTEVKNVLELQIAADNFYAQDQCDKALPLYEELAKAMPTNARNLLRVGNCHAKQQHYSTAEQAYLLALERDPNYAKAWYNLSYIRAKILAVTVSEMYKNIDPSSAEAIKIRKLTVDVLTPFNLELELQNE